MSSTIHDTTLDLWRTGRKVRQSSSGWLSGNAVCCTHNGETPDKKGRGGLMPTGDGGVNYHCFNCRFSTGYSPGRHLSYKFRKLLNWLGADEGTIRYLVIEAIRVKEITPVKEKDLASVPKVEIKARSLPVDAVTFQQAVDDPSKYPHLVDAVKYCVDRKFDINTYDFYVTNDKSHNLHNRVVIPFYWQNKIIGYTARSIGPTIKPKYHNSYEPNYVFNVDRQKPNWKFVVVCEGPLDAISVDGVAILSNECNEVQADIIDSLAREVVVVPDRDRAGKRLVDIALEYGWSVSFPIWQETCKDINEAVIKYGKLFVLKSIIDGRETGRLKIELKKKKLQ